MSERLMRALLIGTCLAIATSARADAIKIGKPTYGARIELVTVSLWVKDVEMVGTVSLDLGGSDEVPREVSIPLSLPQGSRATAMTVTSSGTVARASALQANEARAYYHDAVARTVDPALLEVRGEAMELHVFPVATPGTQRIEITVTMPRAKQLVVHPTGHTIGRLDVTADGRTTTKTSIARVAGARRIALPDAPRGLFEQPLVRVAVDTETSLVVGRASVPSLAPTISLGQTQSSQCDFGGGTKTIRKPIKLAMPRLRYCYERELLRDRTLAGVIHTRFLVRRTGKVDVKEVTGTLTDEVVRSCVADVFASLEYPASDGDTLVNYPLTFRAAEL